MGITCAECGTTDDCCCTGVQIYLTSGDVTRITEHLSVSAAMFAGYARPCGIYADGGGDHTWNKLVLLPDGTRRVLKSLADGSCVFLTPTGCSLPLNVRPLLCRIHPWDFDRDGLKGIDVSCPISAIPDHQETLRLLGMTPQLVGQWHQALYAEILEERAALGLNECPPPVTND